MSSPSTLRTNKFNTFSIIHEVNTLNTHPWCFGRCVGPACLHYVVYSISYKRGNVGNSRLQRPKEVGREGCLSQDFAMVDFRDDLHHLQYL